MMRLGRVLRFSDQSTLPLAAEHRPEQDLSPMRRSRLIYAALFTKPQCADLDRRSLWRSDEHRRAEEIASVAIRWERRLLSFRD